MNRSKLVTQVLTILAEISANLVIISVLTVLMSISGLVISSSGPIIRGIALLFGAFWLSAFSGLMFKLFIDLIIQVRSMTRRLWDNHTPPYAESSEAGLPVVQKSETKAIEKVRKFGIWLIFSYPILSAVSIYIVADRPSFIQDFSGSMGLRLFVLIVAVVLQFPLRVLEETPLPISTSPWDISLILLLIGIPSIAQIFLMGNVTYVLKMQLHRRYHGIRTRFSTPDREYLLDGWDKICIVVVCICLGFLIGLAAASV